VQALLDAVVAYLPSPVDVPPVVGINPDNDKEEIRKPDTSDPFSALAFKIVTDPFVGRLAYFRTYSGELKAGSYVLNTRTGKKERISRILEMHANKQKPLDSLEAGEIAAVVGFKNIKTGDTLVDAKHPVVLESITFPNPVISIAVEARTQADIDKLSTALIKLAEEDPTFKIRTDQDTSQTIISGMGELHLEIIIDRLMREFKVDCNQGTPQVAYKEAITKEIEHHEVLKKQTGGRGKFADIHIEIGPADEGQIGLQFINEIVGGSVPKEYIPAVEKGFAESMSNGMLAGYPLESLKVRLYDGGFHAVDSDQMAFEMVARAAFRNSYKKAVPTLLEPIMKVEIITPEEFTGDVVGDINKRRGIMEGMDTKGNARIIKVKVPLAEMFGYVTQLRTITSGRATSVMEFLEYAEVPNNVSEDIIAKAQGKVQV